MVDDLAVPVKQHLPGEVNHEPGMLKDLWNGDALIRQRVENAADEILTLQGYWPVSWQPAKHAKHVELHLKRCTLCVKRRCWTCLPQQRCESPDLSGQCASVLCRVCGLKSM